MGNWETLHATSLRVIVWYFCLMVLSRRHNVTSLRGGVVWALRLGCGMDRLSCGKYSDFLGDTINNRIGGGLLIVWR